MITIDALQAFGADIKQGLTRCMNNETFYLRLVSKAIHDANFEKLDAAVRSGDLKAAFEAAHALKGVMGNLALTPLYNQISEMTDLLRGNENADYTALLGVFLAKRDELLALCED